jgi:hypothetical protein
VRQRLLPPLLLPQRQHEADAPTVTAESATLNVQKRVSPMPMSMKSTTTIALPDAIEQVADGAANHDRHAYAASREMRVKSAVARQQHRHDDEAQPGEDPS